MIEFSCADFTFPVLSHSQALKLIALLNFSWVDIGLLADRSHLRPADQFAEPQQSGFELKKVTQNEGLGISDIFLQTSLNFSKFAINHPNQVVREDQRDIFERAIEYTASCGCQHLTGLPGVDFNKDSKLICEEELAWRVEYAKPFKITYAVEPHFGSIMENPDDAIRFLERVNGLKITLDHSHYTAQGIEIEKLRPMAKYASHLHARGAAKGEMQTSVERNETDFSAVAEHLIESKFSGIICLEYCYIDWENCNRTDNLSETILLREKLSKQLNII